MPFAPASDVMVDLLADDAPKADCYIDDIFWHSWNKTLTGGHASSLLSSIF